MKGDIVLIPFPFTDLSSVKLRPALILLETNNDVVVAFISSHIPDKPNMGDVIILHNHPEFIKTGLKSDSCIRIDKIATIEKDLIIGSIGAAGDLIRNQVSENICKIYQL